MKSFDLNRFPTLLQQHLMTEEEGIHKIAEFISCNYPVFGLHIYDEDFRAELLVCFLEKGTAIFRNYRPEIGDFFTYLYGYLMNIVSSLKKRSARYKLQEDLTELEIKLSYGTSPYGNKPSAKPVMFLNEPIVPYKPYKISPEHLQKGFYFPEEARVERTILTLTLKASYYLSDIQIHKIAQVINMDETILRDMVEFFRKELDGKFQKRQKMEGYRNKAYYCHRKYEKQIFILREEMKLDFNSTQNYYYRSKIEKLEHNNNKQKSNWERLNYRFQSGFGNIKPSNLAIANLLDISERHVSYYLFCAKTGKTDLTEICTKLEELDKD